MNSPTKVRVTFKDPDVVNDAINAACEESVKGLSLHDDEAERVVSVRAEKMREALRRWVKWSEYIEVEFDTEAMTATVVPVSR